MTADLARLRLIETAARDLLPTLESYSDDIDLIDLRAALRATPVADTAGIDADREELRMALRGAVTDLPQPTLGKAGGVNRGAVIDAIDRVFAAALVRTPKPEGEPE